MLYFICNQKPPTRGNNEKDRITLAKSAHGLVAGADVEVVGVVTVTYDNLKIFDCRYNKDGVEERVKNFPINDYELEFQRVPCVTTCY